jgi:hypothetical protein
VGAIVVLFMLGAALLGLTVAFEGVALLAVLVGWVRHVARVWAMRRPSS